jgi:hypothetical protein
MVCGFFDNFPSTVCSTVPKHDDNVERFNWNSFNCNFIDLINWTGIWLLNRVSYWIFNGWQWPENEFRRYHCSLLSSNPRYISQHSIWRYLIATGSYQIPGVWNTKLLSLFALAALDIHLERVIPRSITSSITNSRFNTTTPRWKRGRILTSHPPRYNFLIRYESPLDSWKAA